MMITDAKSTVSSEQKSVESARLTEFQKRCSRDLETLLREHGRSVGFDLVEGKSDIYLKASVEFEKGQAELYVYDDEAGFFWNGEWSICERPDFESDDALIGAVVAKLRQQLSTGK